MGYNMAYQDIFIMIFGTILMFYISLVTYVQYKLKSKRMNLIEKGLWKPEYEDKNKNIILLTGITLASIGVAILIGWHISTDINICLMMMTGIIPLSMGLSILIYFTLINTILKQKVR